MKTLSRRTALRGGAAVAVVAAVPTVATTKPLSVDGELWALWEQCHVLDQEASRLFGYEGPFNPEREREARKVQDRASALEIRIATTEPVGRRDRAAQAMVIADHVDCMDDYFSKHVGIVARRMVDYFVRAGGAI